MSIATFLQRTPDSVRNRAHRIKAKRPKEKTNEVKEMQTYGICVNCGQSIPLEWSKDLTETEKNQLAALLCDCRKTAVMVEGSGACRYCGQIDVFSCLSTATQAEKDEIVTCACGCFGARRYTEQKAQVESAKDRVHRLFGEGAPDNGFKPIAREKVVELMGVTVGLIAQSELRSITIEITSRVKAKISISSKGKINVERIDTAKCKLEE